MTTVQTEASQSAGPAAGKAVLCATGKVYRFRAELPSLHSTFVLEQLRGFARFMKGRFTSWLSLLFGEDIPTSAYQAFERDLLSGAFKNPELKLVRTLDGGILAAYDDSSQCVRVSRALVDRAARSKSDAWELMIALIEEFGHHVHWSLRNRYSQVGGDAPFDEGALYAHAAVLLDYEKSPTTTFATFIEHGTRKELAVDHTKLHESVRRWLSMDTILDDGRQGSLKLFEPGTNPDPNKQGRSFGHESIELALQKEFDPELRLEIYFGNWLRDYSQLVDPKLVQWVLSRDALTSIVGVLAEVRFGGSAQFKVTSQRLGVYRPEEHIDNPKGLEDKTKVDSAFSTGWKPHDGEIDPKTLLKNYIEDSVKYMNDELNLAATLGPNAEGRRHFGQGLHTLEDFFAHSNFVELTLIKLGYTEVIPWTAPMPLGSKQFPLVTGSFGWVDTAASLSIGLAEQLQKYSLFSPGKRNTSQKIILIILRDRNPYWGRAYESYLNTIETLEKDNPKLVMLFSKTIGALVRLIHKVLGEVIQAFGNTIDEGQTVLQSDPSSTDPTHTQLSKDHDDHPLHVVAAYLAQEPLRKVGKAMLLAWSQLGPLSDPARIATSYICHPKDTTWMNAFVDEWAKVNQDAVRRAASKTWMEDLQKNQLQQIRNKAEAIKSAQQQRKR